MNNEREIVEACIRGESYAQHQLFKKFNQRMLAVCLVYAKDLDEAKDIMMDGFVKVLLGIKDFKFNSGIETWMNRIMTNTAIDYLRKKSKFDKEYNIAEIEDVMDDENDSLEENFISADEILLYIQKLPEGYRLIFCMYALEEIPHKEIAARLNISESTSKSQYSRAKKILREWITERKTIISN